MQAGAVPAIENLKLCMLVVNAARQHKLSCKVCHILIMLSEESSGGVKAILAHFTECAQSGFAICPPDVKLSEWHL